MEAIVSDKEEMFFLGMEAVFASVADHNADLVMFQLFMPHAAAFEKYALDGAIYALGKNWEDGSCSYMVGKRVDGISQLPPDLPKGSVLRSIPASSYVSIKTTPHQLGEEEQGEMARWFEEHPEYQMHPVAVGMEYYPESCRSAGNTMWTWYPITRATG